MALIKCTECGREISDKAPACPNCGCPTSNLTKSEIQATCYDDVISGKKMLLSMNKGAIKETKKLLTASEQVFFSAPLNISVKPVVRKLNDKLTIKGKVNGILTITNKRVLFVESNLGIGTTKQILISDITSIDSKKSFITFPVRICGITDMFVIDCTKDENERILNALNRAR